MRKLRIGQIAPLNLPIPPHKYGGAEKIIYYLCEELVKRGHQVFLFATEDSKTSAQICPVLKRSLWTSKIKESTPYYAYQMAVIAKKAKELKLDILHDHLGPWSLTLYGQINIPTIHTLHVPFKNKDRIWAYKNLNSKLVSISFAQRKPAKDLNYVENIYNGIDVNSFPFNLRPKNYFCWVGELSSRKGIYEVIKIAKMAKINLVLAGRIPPPQQRKDYLFFKKYVEKELNKGKVKYLGELGEKKLKNVYKNAIAFLYPLQWEEPFGLTVIESMACGTPVITFDRGSMREIIKDGKTGFIVKNIDEMVKAMKKIDQISRRDCRKHVEQNFTIEKMVEGYEKLFYKILSRTKKIK